MIDLLLIYLLIITITSLSVVVYYSIPKQYRKIVSKFSAKSTDDDNGTVI